MRRAAKLDDSFDMFLDTITNTFGGVLLITLLIVLMVQQSSEARQSVEEQNSTVPSKALVDSQLAALAAEKQLFIQSKKASATFFDGFVSPEKEENLREVVAQQNLNRRLTRSIDELDVRIVEQTRISNQRVSQSSRLNSLKKRAKDLSRDLEGLKAKQVRTIPLPKERSTSKSSEAFFLQDGSLFRLFLPNGKINRDHFVACRESEADFSDGRVAYRVRIGEGIPLSNQQLQRTFARFNSKRVYLTFVVRAEAFGEFANVRQQAVTAGFEYRIIATDGRISRGGGGAKTQ